MNSNSTIREKITFNRKENKKCCRVFEKNTLETMSYPLQKVSIYHEKLDIYVVDNRYGSRITMGRPWVSLAIDEYSKVIWAMDISLESPSANTIRRLLHHGIFQKHVREKYNTTNEWEVYGIPKTIRLFKSGEFLCHEITALITNTLKANIERMPETFMGNLASSISIVNSIHTKLINSFKVKQINNQILKEFCYSKKNEIITLQDIIELLTVYITDVYHFQSNKSLSSDSNIPMARYQERFAFINTIDDEKENYYRMELLATGFKLYTNKGVVFRNILYSSDEFWELLGREQTKCKIKYDDDISRLFILSPNTNAYVKLSAIKPYHKHIAKADRYS